METGTENRIVLIDGECNLCDGVVQFLIKHDPKKKFRFASLQSNAGKRLAPEDAGEGDDLKSFIFIENGKLYRESSAALRVIRHMDGFWPLLYAFIIVPPFLRNAVYKFIARNRYKWFGKKDVCLLPTPEMRARFINE